MQIGTSVTIDLVVGNLLAVLRTNINITKLDSYIEPGSFEQAQFYADFEGHPEEQRVAWALEEAQFFCTRMQILGTYPRNSFRQYQLTQYKAPHVKG